MRRGVSTGLSFGGNISMSGTGLFKPTDTDAWPVTAWLFIFRNRWSPEGATTAKLGARTPAAATLAHLGGWCHSTARSAALDVFFRHGKMLENAPSPAATSNLTTTFKVELIWLFWFRKEQASLLHRFEAVVVVVV